MNGYVESYRGHVLASECDLMGHMNIQFYGACVSHAMQHMFALIGFSAETIRATKCGFAAVDQKTKFSGELLAGDIMHMESAYVDYSAKSITLNHRLFNSATGALSYETDITALHFDMTARKVIAFEKNVLDVLETLKSKKERL